MIIAIDFDGTIVEHIFPEIGEEVPGAISTLKKLLKGGHKLILWTMRSDVVAPKSENPEINATPGKYLTEAVEWCRERGIEFWGVNENPEQKNWTSSPKVYAHIYIDDAALGCPLIHPEKGRSYVDWEAVWDRWFTSSGEV